MKKSVPSTSMNVAQNRQARFEYAIEETFEAGIMLTSSEVKSLRKGKANITDAYATIDDGEVFLLNAHIAEYSAATRYNHEPKRPRKLLMKRREIHRLAGAIHRQGFTLIPLSLYFNSRGYAKINLGLGKGKKLVDKRQTIKDRDWQRNKARILKGDNES